ncbi:flagellar hook-associated protein FlgK [uncultured Pseudacidovorax sp.]|uniref:flagellar hook-associated protein FlgK n=1 Tax=uncultured Pseudacidovorax sp. TaxID=679313 RepID=UPI0025E3B466|nr:flagellar hook-associated protein FlgK [uncultured Pseudacidovorax sp.]
MSSLLNIGLSALQANQAALTTTGNNVANAGSAGYSRQSVVQQQAITTPSGGGYLGNGVRVVTVERAYSSYLTQQANQTAAVAAADTARSDQLSSLESVFQTGSAGLGASMNTLLNAFTSVASAPTDLSARTVVLTQAGALASRFSSAQTQLDEMGKATLEQLGTAADNINRLGASLAKINGQIQRARGSGQEPNDLLDQRDALLTQLNGQVQTSTMVADDGTLSVFVGNQALVLGSSSSQVSVGTAADGSSTLDIARGSVVTHLDAAALGGGAAAGQLRFLNEDLPDTRNLLGRLALTMTSTVNAQHSLGVGLNGETGNALFGSIAVPDSIPAATNTGNATFSTTVSDVSALVPSSYTLSVQADGSYQVRRLSDNSVSSFASLPAQIDGLSIGLQSGAGAAGDVYRIEPFSQAAGKVAVALGSAGAVAAGSPVQASTGTGNKGSLAVSGVYAIAQDANLTATATLSFNADGTYNISGAGTGNLSNQTYTAGEAIKVNGWSLTLTGVPKAGDTVTVQAATAAMTAQNSGNATALQALADQKLIDGSPLSDGYAGLIARVGVRAQGAKYAAQVSSAIATSTETARANSTGVNLDEEATKLLAYQQAYQASARVIQIAQNIFDSLLSSVR